jgi:hypothetical protein
LKFILWTVNFSVKPTFLLLRLEVFMADVQCLESVYGNIVWKDEDFPPFWEFPK